MSDEATRGRRLTAIRQYECPHMTASGWLQSLRCWVCGPLRATWVQRPVLPVVQHEPEPQA